MAFTDSFTQSNVNKAFSVFMGVYAVMFLCLRDKFFGMYFSEKEMAMEAKSDLFVFFTRCIGLMWFVFANISWKFNGSTAVTFFNLFTSSANLLHVTEILYWNLYAQHLWIDQKRNWQVQLLICALFTYLIYVAWNNSDKNAETTAPASSTGVKSIGSWQLSGYNVNRLMGVFLFLYGITITLDPATLFSHYFLASEFNFHLFGFLSRLMGITMLASAVASYNYAGAESMNAANVGNMVLSIIHFAVVVWGGSVEPANLGDNTNMWYIQLLINVVFLTIAILGLKDARERGNTVTDATATSTATPKATNEPGAGSML
jgi:hypothetical protein